MAEESGNRSNLSTRFKKYKKEAPFFCKIIELIFCVISVGLIVDPFNQLLRRDINMNHAGVVYVAICGYILINSIVILCYLYGEKLPKKMALLFSGVGAVLCLTAGLLLIQMWNDLSSNLIFKYLQQYSDQIISSGVFAILAAAVFVLDTYFTNKDE